MVGGLLLKLLFVMKVYISWVDVFFIVMLVVIVIGLGVVDIVSIFMMFGEIVIMFLI